MPSLPDRLDAVVIGGGIMGCAAALRMAEGGMRIAIVEQNALGSGATGVNAGTLSLQIKRVSLMPYAIRGAELWAGMGAQLGLDIHFHRPGGLNLAFTEAEEELLVCNMTERREAGLPIEFVSANRARDLEPALTTDIRLASHCPWDGYASSSLTGRAFRSALIAAGVEVREWDGVTAVVPEEGGFTVVTGRARLAARRVLLATGAWSRPLLAGLGVDLPVGWRVNQMSVTERTGPLLNGVIGHISGLMSLKQAVNGTVIIGGGWQGEGAPGEAAGVKDGNLLNNLRFARHALPRLADLRLVRTWFGYDSFAPDHMPMAGAVPGVPEAFMIACVRGGYTIGPCMGRLVADLMLGREPELPLFDPARFIRAGRETPHVQTTERHVQ